jgi:DNA processing protein
MIYRLHEPPHALRAMKKPPTSLAYIGNLELLKRPKVSIVGTRRPLPYTRQATYNLAKALAQRGVCVVSGVAMGVDAIAHEGAGVANTIAVVASGVDIRYPSVNKNLIASIEREGLVMSQFKEGFRPTSWSFVVRNEVVVALGDMLIVSEADLNSGSMRSVEFALQMGKPIFVLPHRLDESLATNRLLMRGDAQAIYDIEAFASRFGEAVDDGVLKDDFFYACQKSPTFDELVALFGDRVYEAELEGMIAIEDGIVRLL